MCFDFCFQEELFVDQEAIVTFRFRQRCEYVVVGSRFIFRSSSPTKGSGTVVQVIPQQALTN